MDGQLESAFNIEMGGDSGKSDGRVLVGLVYFGEVPGSEAKVYPNQINSFARYLIANMEAKSITNPPMKLRLRRVSGFIPLPY